MKPSGLSRGRGIQVHNNINKILNLIIEEKDVYVAQKYIEYPLIVNKRKFDIRQWVLVTDFNPLTIFIYDEFYVRFALYEYDPESNDKYIHLSNNSVVKYADDYDKLKNENEMKGLMWEMSRLAKYIKDLNNGKDVFSE